VAEVAYNYLFSGAAGLALTLFEGLVAVAPNEAYFALAVGLAHDRTGSRDAAAHWYGRAAELDPRDPTPDLNRAELALADRDYAGARPLLARARKKACVAAQPDLRAKSDALIAHTETTVDRAARSTPSLRRRHRRSR